LVSVLRAAFGQLALDSASGPNSRRTGQQGDSTSRSSEATSGNGGPGESNSGESDGGAAKAAAGSGKGEKKKGEGKKKSKKGLQLSEEQEEVVVAVTGCLGFLTAAHAGNNYRVAVLGGLPLLVELAGEAKKTIIRRNAQVRVLGRGRGGCVAEGADD
jgi:hypothetical protein